MTILVLGATGATGRLLVQQLLDRGHHVKAIVRSPDKLPEELRDHPDVSLIEGSLLDLTDAQMAEHVAGCDAVASCLGHNLTAKGIFAPPRRLVADATRRLCDAIEAARPGQQTKFVLMNTAGNRNRDLDEPISLGQRAVIGLLRLLVPPHADNEDAADYLRRQIGPKHPRIGWVVVRPDSLTNDSDVTDYELHPSPTRSAIFDPGTTSRINVAHFMAELVTDRSVWNRWRGQMPVIYNRATPSS